MHTLGFLARLVDGELHGDAEQTIRGAASIDEAGPEHITFASDDRTLEKARHGQAGAVIVAERRARHRSPDHSGRQPPPSVRHRLGAFSAAF